MARDRLIQPREMTMGKPVLVTTEYRGVFFGYADDTSGDEITLIDARNCIYWSADIGGFGGLAVTGPSDLCRIGAQIQKIRLRKVTSVSDVTETAVSAWTKARVHNGT
jgi:hypothetical protein